MSDKYDIQAALDYLANGGLGEVVGITDMAMNAGFPKVQSDPDMIMALCMLASKAIEAGLHQSLMAVRQ